LILGGFRRLGMWPAVLAAGFLFGLAHSSIYRLLPTFFLGVLFGLAVWKTGSIYAGMICHALNNGLMVMVARHKPFADALRASDSVYLPWTIIGAGAVALAAGLWLIWTARDQDSSTPVTA
jgi:sodium transport system permease protein